jgi:acetylornithine deacetylase
MTEQFLHREGEYEVGRDLMDIMVTHSQRPGDGNQAFVNNVADYATGLGLNTRTVADPDYADRSLLVVDVGDPEGEQKLAVVSHADVVGVEDQAWETDPWTLHEADDTWFGRGTCDTHGSGVAMLLAANREEISKNLEAAGARVSIIFTYDEEAQSSDMSYRGARLAAGLLGNEPIATAPYYIAGEPTEFDGNMVAMRSHKGRWLAHYVVRSEQAGHAANDVQNALATGCDVAHRIGQYAALMRDTNYDSETDGLFAPPYSTAQITAADVKKADLSTTPDYARFTVDMRTIPSEHERRARDIIKLFHGLKLAEGLTLNVEMVDEFPGTVTRGDSPIVLAAERATGHEARGFSGGDEGEVFRLEGKEGVTLGPGELKYAHMPNERIAISSIAKAVDTYSHIFSKIGTR